jgi:glycosyltransferase involved in cell wall biosynthesis
MRLGLLIYGDLDTISGGYLYDRKLVEHLERAGDQVEVISLPWRNYVRHLGDNLSTALLRRLAGFELDFLLQDELNHPSLFHLNRRLRRRVAYPLVAIVHHLRSSEARPAWQNRLYRWVERRYLRSVDAFVFNSQTTRQAVAGLAGCRQPSLVAYPAGDRLKPRLAADQIAARTRSAGPLQLFFLGNVIPRKGLHLLLEAASRLPRRSWSLAVAGDLEVDKAYARRIRRQVKACALEQNVRFLGPLKEHALIERFSTSHVLVVPSSYEGFGIAYLEAMGFGLPAIATTAGAAGEIITPGQDGYLVPPGDAPALAACLGRLVEDRQTLLAMSLAARRRYESHPTWEETGEQMRAFLENVRTLKG